MTELESANRIHDLIEKSSEPRIFIQAAFDMLKFSSLRKIFIAGTLSFVLALVELILCFFSTGSILIFVPLAIAIFLTLFGCGVICLFENARKNLVSSCNGSIITGLVMVIGQSFIWYYFEIRQIELAEVSFLISGLALVIVSYAIKSLISDENVITFFK